MGRDKVGVEALSRRTSVQGTGTRGLGFGGGIRARDANTIYDAGTSQNKSQYGQIVEAWEQAKELLGGRNAERGTKVWHFGSLLRIMMKVRVDHI